MHIIGDDGDSLEEMGPKVFLKRNLSMSNMPGNS